MNFFWFERSNNFNIKTLSLELEDNGFCGILLPYSFYYGDQFVKIANSIDINKKIKYMVAIRPYTISAQYLSMINSSFNEICKDRISINLITGWIHEQEKNVGGIQGEITDLSSNIDRSNYLIKYIDSLHSIKEDTTKVYVSVTNEILFDLVKEENVIIPYYLYKDNRFEFVGKNTMISILPIIRKTKEDLDLVNKETKASNISYFTEDEFALFLQELNEKEIKNILITEDFHNKEKENILSFVGRFTNKQKQLKNEENK
jgi:hypothetical protein